jgi:hypothetical protein
MTEFMNFHGSWILVQHNWIWVILALALGIWCGWSTSAQDETR